MLLVNVFHKVTNYIMHAVTPGGNGESYDDANVDSVMVIYVAIWIFHSKSLW